MSDHAVKPVQIPPRRIPKAFQKPLKDHLDELEEQEIIPKSSRSYLMGELSHSKQEEQWENISLL